MGVGSGADRRRDRRHAERDRARKRAHERGEPRGGQRVARGHGIARRLQHREAREILRGHGDDVERQRQSDDRRPIEARDDEDEAGKSEIALDRRGEAQCIGERAAGEQHGDDGHMRVDQAHDEEEQDQRQHQSGGGPRLHENLHDERQHHAREHGRSDRCRDLRHQIAQGLHESRGDDRRRRDEISAHGLIEAQPRRAGDQRGPGGRPGGDHGNAMAPAEPRRGDRLDQANGGDRSAGLRGARPHRFGRRDDQRHRAAEAHDGRDERGRSGARAAHSARSAITGT